MSEIVYNGAHALMFQATEEDPMIGPWDNSWDRWHIAPSSRPYVVPPSPKTEYVDVPGADGSLDFTEVLTGVRYSDRVGSWEFIVDHSAWKWTELYTQFMTAYQGKDIRVRLVDDPDYYYEGRIALKDYKQGKDYSTFEIEYHLEPYKYPIDSTANRYWKWNDLFGKPVFYGPYMADTVHINLDTGKPGVLKESYTKITKFKAGDNPKANGWYRHGTADYPVVIPRGDENPKKKKWYERTGEGTQQSPYHYEKSTDTTVDPSKTYCERVVPYELATEEKRLRGVEYFRKTMVEVPDTDISTISPNDTVCRNFYNDSKERVLVSINSSGVCDYELYTYRRTVDAITGKAVNVMDLEYKDYFRMGENNDLFLLEPREVKMLKILNGVTYLKVEMSTNKLL